MQQFLIDGRLMKQLFIDGVGRTVCDGKSHLDIVVVVQVAPALAAAVVVGFVGSNDLVRPEE
jgi:hypothetical protein